MQNQSVSPLVTRSLIWSHENNSTLASKGYAFARWPSENQDLAMALWHDPIGVSSGAP